VKEGTIITADSARRYLKSKFGEVLATANSAMQVLAKAYTPKQPATKAFKQYEEFRRNVLEGVKGWGAPGVLDLDAIGELAKAAKK
jgi:hypothetical protein